LGVEEIELTRYWMEGREKDSRPMTKMVNMAMA
jgi:hypothetical protein